MIFTELHNSLSIRRKTEMLLIEPWGKDSLRVRATQYPSFTGRNWALSEEVLADGRNASVVIEGSERASIENGRLKLTVNAAGVLSFFRDGVMFLREYYRSYFGTESKESSCLKIINRDYKPIIGGDYTITVRFESNDGEKLFGMGQYQQPYLDLKGCVLELAQRNSQVSIPFAVSSLGYGFLWNNPTVGRTLLCEAPFEAIPVFCRSK